MKLTLCIIFSLLSISTMLFLAFGPVMFSFSGLASAFSEPDLKSTVLLISIALEMTLLIMFGFQEVKTAIFVAVAFLVFSSMWPFLADSSLIEPYLTKNIAFKENIVIAIASIAIAFSTLLKYYMVEPLTRRTINGQNYLDK